MKTSTRLVIQSSCIGIAAAFVYLALSLVVRTICGVGTIIELLGDRTAPFLGIPLFFRLLNTFGGYSHLKEAGVIAIMMSEVGSGALVGLMYALIAQRKGSKFAAYIAAILVSILTILLVIGLWPNLSTNYDGLPPGRALKASIATLCLLSTAFVCVFLWLSHRSAGASHEDLAVERRRWFLAGGVSTFAALVSTILLTRFYHIATYSYDGTVNTGDDLPPITPNNDFYQVTKNQVDPRPTLADWRLEVGGSVARPQLLQRRDLDQFPVVIQETTLQCISDPTDGGLNSNAQWKGVPLYTVLRAAGLSPATKQIMFHGADGFVDDLPVEKALDPHTLLVYEMNGEVLPQRHGFPVRLIVPGYVGEKSVKWLTKIEARDTPGKGFYEQQGWGPQFTINDTTRFDTDFSKALRVGQRTVLKGTAFAGDRGVAKVEVSADDGKTWGEAEITYRGSDLAWVQWRFPWQPKQAGEVKLAARCTDRQGGVESGIHKPSAPNPATGYGTAKAMVQS